MATPGRKPKPTILKAAAGNPGRRQLNDGEPVPPPPPAGGIQPPDWVCPTGLKVWEQLAPIATQMKVLTTADVLAFARYCHTFGKWLDLEAKIKTEFKGQTTYTRFDEAGRIQYMAEIPHAVTARKLEQMLTRYEEEFGLTPAARTRIHVEHGGGPTAQPTAEDERKRLFFVNRGKTAPPSEVG